MKYHCLFFSALCVLISLSSCTHDTPEIEKCISVEECTDMVVQYFPYTKNVPIQFVSENDEVLTMVPVGAGADSVCPIVAIETPFPHMPNEKESNIAAFFYVGEDFPTSNNRILCQIFFPEADNNATLDWYFSIQWEKELSYTTFVRSFIPLQQPYSTLTDTIELPILYIADQRSALSPAPANAYMRMIRNQGITEFSVDGQTIWKRVK